MGRAHKWLAWGVCIAAGMLLGIGLYTFRYAEGLSYLSNDPTACMNCHVMRDHFDSWVRSSHRLAATCNDCHVPHGFPAKYLAKIRNGWNHSRAFTLQNFSDPIRIRPSNLAALQHNCLQCHAGLVSDIAAHQDVKRGEARCTVCHRSVGHLSGF
jgi:cytochrome c nitrite reductase small subunit